MSEEEMVDHVQAAITRLGIDDTILAAGEFSPRGHSGSMFIGGMGGSLVGEFTGSVGEAVGVGVGSLAGARENDRAAGLPSYLIVGASESSVYGFAGRRSSTLTEPVFSVRRSDIEVVVHQRVNVRVLELVDHASGSSIELEGNRVPLTHSKAVIDLLS